VENVLEALDDPGEWVLNTHKGRLYLWPRGDSPGENITAPRLVELIRVEGRVDAEGPVDTPDTHLVFRGLTFTHADRDVWTATDAGIQHDWEMYDKSTALMRFRATEHCLVDECGSPPAAEQACVSISTASTTACSAASSITLASRA
jgi:hypothetical protein